MSLIGRKTVESIHPEWQTDALATPDLTNNRPEGNDWTYDALTATTRVGNYTQISDKPIIVSRTQDKTSKAGRKSELAYQVAKKGRELKTDMEAIVLQNQAASAGSGNGASNRTLGGFRSWVQTNDDLGGGGSSGSISNGLPTAATNGTQRAFTKTILDSVILNTHNSGGNADVFMCSTYVKTVFSTFLDDVNIVPVRKNMSGGGQATLVAAADMYQSDFGLITMVPNRQMTRAGAAVARNAFLIDPEMVSLGVFDDISIEKPGKTGDAEKRVLVTEYTLLVNNEAAHGCAADLYGISASA